MRSRLHRELFSVCVTATVALAIALVPSRASAQPSSRAPWSLEWSAPQGCPDAAWVENRIAAMAAGVPRVATADRVLVIRGNVVRDQTGRWRLLLETSLGSSHGNRMIDGANCSELADAATVLVAMTLDPTRALSVDVPSGSPSPSSSPLSSAPPSSSSSLPPSSSSSPPQSSSPQPVELASASPSPSPSPASTNLVLIVPIHRMSQFSFGIAGGLDYGMLPGFGGGVIARAGFRRRFIQLGFDTTYWPTRSITLASRPGTGGHFDAVTLAIHACVVLPLRIPILSGCAGLEGGATVARGFGVSDPGQSIEPWFAGTVNGDLAVPLGNVFAIRLSLGIAVPVIVPRYVLESIGTVYHAEPITFRGALGLEFHFSS